VHPIRGPELWALRRLQRDYAASPYVFARALSCRIFRESSVEPVRACEPIVLAALIAHRQRLQLEHLLSLPGPVAMR